MLSDLRHAARSLLRRPAFAGAVVLTLALTIGANVAIFAVIYAMLLRPLPFPDPDQLVAIEVEGSGEVGKLAGREVRDIAKDSETIADFATFYPSQYNVTGGGLPESLVTMIGTSNLFRVFGVRMLHGDTWPVSLDWTSGQYVVVLGHSLWQQRYGSDPSIVGRSVKLDGADYLVAGVLPPGFDYPAGTRLYRAVSGYTTSAARRFTGVARLKAGVTRAQAQVELDGFSARFADQFPDTNRGLRFVVRPLRDVFVGPVRPYLWLLAAAVMFVLLLACANITNLMLSRTLGQRSELAVRTAIGASRMRIVRHVVAEAIVLAAAGGAAGFMLGSWAVRAMTTLVRLQLPAWLEVRTEWPVAIFTAIVALTAAAIVASVPALQASRADVRDALGEGSHRMAGGRRQQIVLRGLVAVQVAMAVVLLTGATLMARSVIALTGVDPGFRSERLITFRTDPPWTRYGGTESIALFYRRALERLSALPGVSGVAIDQQLPFGGIPDTTRTVIVEGQSTATAANERPFVNYQVISPNYFAVMGIPLISGRTFTDDDRLNTLPVAIISERAAKRFWPGADAVGKRLTTMWRIDGTGTSTDSEVQLTIVGVVGDVRFDGLAANPGMDLYTSVEQTFAGDTFFAVRTSGDPDALMSTMSAAIRDVDPEQSIFDVRVMEARAGDTVWQQRASGALMVALAALALMLAAVGTYGVLAYAVAQRQREIGVRVALGARPSEILATVVRQGMWPVWNGLAAGMLIAAGSVRVLSRLLYGVTASDPVSIVGAPLALMLVALLACLLPARRAANLDPVDAIRAD
jgi:putative ABC transport system permease protein